MPSFTGGGLSLTWGFIPHEDGWADSYNLNFQKLDAVVQLSVISILSTPPGTPASEDNYIVGATATGAWAGQEDDLAVWTKKEDPDSRAWVFFTPEAGYRAWNIDTTSWWQFSGSAWVEDTSELPAPGTNGQVLTLVTGAPAWADLPAGTGFDLTEGGVWTGDAAFTKGTVVTYGIKRYIASVDIAVPTGTPGLDGEAHVAAGGGGTMVVAGLDTTGTADTIVIVSAVNHDGTTITGITSDSGLVFAAKSAITRTNISGHRLRLEIWTAPAPAVLTNEDITITYLDTNPTSKKAVAFGVFGGDIGDPFDANANSIKTASGDRTAPGVIAFSTSNADDLLIFAAASDSDGSSGLVANTAPATWTLLNYQGNATDDSTPNVVNLAVSTKLVSAGQSAISISDGGDPSVWGAIAVAVKASGAANLSPALDPQWIVTDEGTAEIVSADLDAVLGSTPGSIAVRGATDWESLVTGTENNVLTVVSGVPAWAENVGGGGGGSGNLVLVAELTANNTADNLEWTGLTSDNYILVVTGLTPATNAADLVIQFGTGATPTWVTSGYHAGNRYFVESSGVNGLTNLSSQSGMQFANVVDNTGGGCLASEIMLFGLASAIRHTIRFTTNRLNGGVVANLIGFGTAPGTTAVTAVRIKTSTGNLLSGKAALYRVAAIAGVVIGTGYRIEAPTTGATIALNPEDVSLVLNPAAAIATLTVTMPTAVDGQRIDITTRQRIDALTITGAGSDAVDWPDGELPQYGTIGLLYVASLTAWVMT